MRSPRWSAGTTRRTPRRSRGGTVPSCSATRATWRSTRPRTRAGSASTTGASPRPSGGRCRSPEPRGAFCFTPAPVWNPVATCTVKAQPDNDFFGWDGFSTQGASIRWYILFRYPLGVRLNEGEDWFLNVHAPEVCKQPGLTRFFSYKCEQAAIPLPGMWHPDATPPQDMMMVQWDRVVELWYPSFSAWRKAVIEEPPEYTRAGVGDRRLLQGRLRHVSVLQARRGLREHLPARASRRRVPARHALLPSVNALPRRTA